MVKGKGIVLTSFLLLALAFPSISSGQNFTKKKNIIEVIEEEQKKAEEADEQLKQRIPKLSKAKSYGDSIRILYKGCLDYPIKGILTSKFGIRVNPLEESVGGSKDYHYGIDISAPKGTPIKAPFNGEIIKGGYNKSIGWFIKFRLNSGIKIEEPIILFGHLSRLSKKYTKASEKNPIPVKKGEWFLYSGNSGEETTGPHLHYAFFIKNRFTDPQGYSDQRFKKNRPYGE